MTKVTTLIAICVIGLFFYTSDQDRGMDQKVQRVGLEKELYDITADTKLHFTIEYYHKDADHPSPMMNAVFEPGRKFIRSDDVVEFLKSQLPGVSITLDAKESRVIHLTDGALVSNPHNPMTRAVTLKYDGTPSELIMRLRPLVANAVQIRPLIGDSIDGDYLTRIAFSADNLEVRSVLSDFLPLDDYSAVLWISEAKGDIDKEFQVEVGFLGPLNWTSTSRPTTKVSVTRP